MSIWGTASWRSLLRQVSDTAVLWSVSVGRNGVKREGVLGEKNSFRKGVKVRRLDL